MTLTNDTYNEDVKEIHNLMKKVLLTKCTASSEQIVQKSELEINNEINNSHMLQEDIYNINITEKNDIIESTTLKNLIQREEPMYDDQDKTELCKYISLHINDNKIIEIEYTDLSEQIMLILSNKIYQHIVELFLLLYIRDKSFKQTFRITLYENNNVILNYFFDISNYENCTNNINNTFHYNALNVLKTLNNINIDKQKTIKNMNDLFSSTLDNLKENCKNSLESDLKFIKNFKKFE